MRKLLILYAILFSTALGVLPGILNGEPPEPPKNLHFAAIDPRPVVIPNANFAEIQTNTDGTKTPKHWTLQGKGFLSQDEETKDVSLHLYPGAYWASEPVLLKSGEFYQVKTRYCDPLRGKQDLYFGFDFATMFCGTYYKQNSADWITLSCFQQVPYDTSEAKVILGMETYRSSGTIEREKTIQYGPVELQPAQCVYQAIRKNTPLNDIYWGRQIGVPRTPPPGEFLLLGEHERLSSNSKTKTAQYHLNILNQDYDFTAAEKSPNPLPMTLHRRPIIKSKLHQQAQIHSNSWTFDKESEVIFRFDFQPIQIHENGGYEAKEPISILSAKLWFTFNYTYSTGFGGKDVLTAIGSEDKGDWTTIEYGDDGLSWKKLQNTARWQNQRFEGELENDFFPKKQLYLRIRMSEAMKKQRYPVIIRQFGFDAELDTNDYGGYGKQTFYEVTPGTESWNGPTKIWPLFCATNQMYFLYRNESDQPILPKIGGKHDYSYYGPVMVNPVDTAAPNPEFSPSWQSQPRTVQYEMFPNNPLEINDLVFHWEVVGSKDGTIPPKSERIVVFTLEAKRLRASSHQQFGSYIGDMMGAEFRLGPYNLMVPKVCFFPPRLAIE